MIDTGKNYEKLPDILDEYEVGLGDAYDNLSIKDKTLEFANREQPNWIFYYDNKRIELEGLLKYFEQQVNRVRSRLFMNYTENYSIELSDKAKQMYIDKEQDYIVINTYMLEVKELYKKYDSLVEAFKARGYALKNITEARINQVYNEII